MKTARILLAVLSLAALGACGNDPTAPSALTPGSARHETAPAPGDDATTDNTSSGTGSAGETPSCSGTIVVSTDSSGNIVYTCVATPPRGGQFGSGG